MKEGVKIVTITIDDVPVRGRKERMDALRKKTVEYEQIINDKKQKGENFEVELYKKIILDDFFANGWTTFERAFEKCGANEKKEGLICGIWSNIIHKLTWEDIKVR